MTTYKFEFTEQEVNFILLTLSELPFKTSYQLINKIQSEAQKQVKPVPLSELGLTEV